MKIITVFAAMFAFAAASACNTVEGAGEDIQSAGEAVEEAGE